MDGVKSSGFDAETIFHAISDPVSMHDRQFRIVRVNGALCRFLGLAAEEIVGRFCYEVFHGRDDNWPGCPQLQMQQQRAPVTELIDDPVVGRPLLVTCSPVFGPDSELLGAVHVCRDISGERQRLHDAEKTVARLRKTISWFSDVGGLITICASCRHVQKDDGEWQQLEKLLADNTGILFSHGMCPTCFHHLFPEDNTEGEPPAA